MSPHSLPLTGERTLPGIDHENYWFQRHVAGYHFAATRCQGLRVLDTGCGEGYGAALLLATGAGSVVGAERDPTVMAHARAAYPRIEVLECDLAALPLPDASFDAVVSSQVIEHLPDVDACVAEIARVLRPGGELICATPNRATFPPGNPFHLTEFSAAELAAVLGRHLRVKAVLGVHHGPRLRTVERLTRRSFVDLMLATSHKQWPAWLRVAVARIRPADFAIRAADVDASLDLLAIAARPRA